LPSFPNRDRDIIVRKRKRLNRNYPSPRVHVLLRHLEDRDNGCVAVLAPGDLTQHTCVQELIAFRQLYEHDYPGIDGGAIKGADDDDYDCYGGGGARINYPVFPILGNHDDPSEIKMECDHHWDKLLDKWYYSPADRASNWCSWGEVCHRSYVGDYIEDRLGDDIYYRAADDVSGYNNGNYAFELGSFHFIMGGLWPGYGGYYEDQSVHVPDDEHRNMLDPDKLKWLTNYLEKAVRGQRQGGGADPALRVGPRRQYRQKLVAPGHGRLGHRCALQAI